jgi:hypothetical protein
VRLNQHLESDEAKVFFAIESGRKSLHLQQQWEEFRVIDWQIVRNFARSGCGIIDPYHDPESVAASNKREILTDRAMLIIKKEFGGEI